MTTTTETPRFTGPCQTPPQPILDAVLLIARTVDGAPDHLSAPETLELAVLAADSQISAHLACLALSSSYRDGDTLLRRLAEVQAAVVSRDLHATTGGHDECCGGECRCSTLTWAAGLRCDTCERAPHEGVEQAAGGFLDAIGRHLGYSCFDRVYALASTR